MSVFRLLPVVVALGLALSPGLLLAQANSGKDAKSLSDSDRAKRDADKVFSFIKFHTVRSAPAPAPAKPAAQAAQAAPPTRSLVVATAPASQPAAATSASVGTAATSSAAAPAATVPSTLAAEAASAAEPTVTTADLPADAASAAATLSQAPLQAAPQVEEEEVPLRLVDYVAPDMSAQVLAAMPSNEVTVPVRFTVQPDGRVSSAQAMGGGAPRRVAQAAVRAVQQWRFDPLPAERTVDVEINFKAE
jgi:TonB family protein